jgi:hypothetical protein
MVAGLALCVALHPGLVLKRDESGLSNYGIHARTVIPYSVALATASATALVVAMRGRVLGRGDRRAFTLYAVLMAAELVSTYPYMVNHTWHTVHVVVGVALVTAEFVVTCWWAAGSSWAWRGVAALEGGGTLLGALTVANVVHVLFLAQVLANVAFGALMVERTRRDPTLTPFSRGTVANPTVM